MDRRNPRSSDAAAPGVVLLYAFVAIFCLLSCATIEAHSVSGEPLSRVRLTAEKSAKLNADLARAKALSEAQPDRADLAIWVGRRLAYLGRYREAIAWYDQCEARFGATPEILRHRGHRSITVRDFAHAETDLLKASMLTASSTDSVEPDGIETPAGPRSTLRGNIEYHLALAYFCEGKLDEASAAWQRARMLSTNDDTLAAVCYWSAVTHFERGDRDAALAALAAITTSMDVRENGSYQRLCLVLKGELKCDELVAHDSALGINVDRATLGFGRAMHARHILRNETAAREHLTATAGLPEWAAFGVIASEATLARANK